MCSGFWLAQLLAFSLFGVHGSSLITGFLLAAVGDILYQLKLKVIPCTECTGEEIKLNEWKVS